MRTRIVKIGNSQGIRIPKLLLERSKLAEEVELEAEDISGGRGLHVYSAARDEAPG